MPRTSKFRHSWKYGMVAGLLVTAAGALTAPRAVAQDLRLTYPTADAASLTWDNAVREFRSRNPLAGTVMIGRDVWTPERQARDPQGFREAVVAAEAQASSPEAVAARKAERDRMAEAQRVARERRDEEDAADRQVRMARLSFEWQRITGFRLAEAAVPVRIAEARATATANALALQASKINVIQSPGMQATPVTPSSYSPEQKARVVRRFLAGDAPLSRIAADSHVRADVARQWVKQALEVE